MNPRAIATDLKRQFIDGEPVTETGIIALMVITLCAFLTIPFVAISSSYYASAFSFRSATVEVSAAKPEIRPVLVASAEQAGTLLAPTSLAVEPTLVPKEPELIEHPVRMDETLIGILKAYCRDDYQAVARDNGLADPDRIYAGKTVLKFTNGCLGNAPSVLVKQSVSPRELVSNGGASSGKHISPTEAIWAPITAPAVVLAASAPTGSASQPQATRPVTIVQTSPAQATTAAVTSVMQPARRIRVAGPPVQAVQCDSEEVAPKELIFNERARRMQICFMKHHRLNQVSALKKAKNLLVAALPKPDVVSCEDTAKQGLNSWARCMRTHHGEALRAAAIKYRHDENLLLAIAHTESKGNPFAVSTSWCLSIMQVLPSTAEKFGVDLRTIFVPHVNFDTGAKVLRAYLDIARGDVNRALASYNLGPGDVNNRMKSPEGFDPGSFEYTQKVIRAFRALRANGHAAGVGSKSRPAQAAHAEKDRVTAVAAALRPAQTR